MVARRPSGRAPHNKPHSINKYIKTHLHKTSPSEKNLPHPGSTCAPPIMSDRDLKKLATRLSNFLDTVYTLKNNSGYSIANDFHKLPPRTGTDYYKFITRPISLHTIGRTVKRFDYKDPQDFINDLAQITWNARHYNEPGSEIYEDALILDTYIKDTVIPKLASDPKVISQSGLFYPDLGPLDDYDAAHFDHDNASASPFMKAEEYDEDDHLTSYHHSAVKSSASLHAPRTVEGGVRRGRPPIIDKPYESRIKSILKNFKKIRHPDNENIILTAYFERLPDKNSPGYYEIIERPISLHEIRAKVRSRKYSNVQQFLDDLALMISNSKLYYAADPAMTNDILLFEKQAEQITEREMLRPEEDFIVATSSGSDGLKTPLDSVTVNEHTYKVGDWVLIKNPNDANKPICGQIFRLWSTDGIQYTNVCWYIRPEQTCHRVDRLFYINEVCKTGEYRDHLAEDIVAPCYVIFLTHYQKGDIPPSLLPPGSEWFICEFRYNANNYVFNRIRTWKACLPDEIRHIDQPIVPINEPRKLIKYESPIKTLLPATAHEDMEITPPTQGPNANGPPIVGSVYLRAPFVTDELGQCSTSPNVTMVPELDDPNSGRKAYLFTPVSQLKSVSGSGIYSSSGTRSVSANYAPGLNEEHQPPLMASSSFDNAAYKQQSPYIPLPAAAPFPPPPPTTTYKPFVHKRPEMSPNASLRGTPLITAGGYNSPMAGSYHTSTSAYSNILPGGVVLYTEKAEEEDAADLQEISENLVNFNGRNVWFRAPPNKVSSAFASPVGHTAKYLAWKAKKYGQ